MTAQKNAPNPALVQQFGLCLDEGGILRCKGRIQQSSLTEEGKCPILLPSKHNVVELIVKDAHDRLLHSGVATTLTAIRERFWIARGRQTVKRMCDLQEDRRKIIFHTRPP